MKRKRHTPNQIIAKLREAERMLGEGKLEIQAHKEGDRCIEGRSYFDTGPLQEALEAVPTNA